ncbi:MAG: dephospho-CoA kinase [Campylobacterales bacterium]|nr:dephospho-CoA kinase [Campylobacterales bacterium]
MAFEHAIALTGGIASGKSTVATLLGLHGLRVIDADAIAHAILDQESSWAAERFGAHFVVDGKVDRAALGRLIFSDAQAKADLEAHLHPRIRIEIERQSEQQERFGFPYLIDIPLFFEKGSYPIADSVIVYAPKSVCLERYQKRSGMSREECLRRIDAQMDIEEKKRRATWVIDNSGNLKHLQRECETFVEMIKKKYHYKN